MPFVYSWEPIRNPEIQVGCEIIVDGWPGETYRVVKREDNYIVYDVGGGYTSHVNDPSRIQLVSEYMKERMAS